MFGGVFSLKIDNTVINIWRCHLFLHLLATFVCVYLLIILNFPRKRRFIGVLFLLPPCPSEHASFLHFFCTHFQRSLLKSRWATKQYNIKSFVEVWFKEACLCESRVARALLFSSLLLSQQKKIKKDKNQFASRRIRSAGLENSKLSC